VPSDDDVRAFRECVAGLPGPPASHFGDDRLLQELDTRVEKLGAAVSWEIGPGTTQPCALSITPDGDPELLPVCKHIVSLAPTVPGWEIHPAKPPKQWDLQFTVQLKDGALELDARRWTYVLFEGDDGRFDIVIAAPELDGVDEVVRDSAGKILVDAMLGEATRLAHVASIEVDVRLPDDARANASKVADLAKHFVQLLAS